MNVISVQCLKGHFQIFTFEKLAPKQALVWVAVSLTADPSNKDYFSFSKILTHHNHSEKKNYISISKELHCPLFKSNSSEY